MTGQDWSLRQTQVQTYVNFTTFMTAVVVFFVGLLLASFKNFDISIKVPIAYLIISIFGFLYSTLIYTGAATEITHKREAQFKKSMLLADVISEYLGVYLVVVSIPFVIGAVTNDAFLRLVSIIAAGAGLIIYQFSHVSMIERHFTSINKILSPAITLFSILLYFSQIYDFYFVPLSVLFLLCMLVIVHIAIKNEKALI